MEEKSNDVNFWSFIVCMVILCLILFSIREYIVLFLDWLIPLFEFIVA